jgi:hypothetical protein
LYVLELKHLHPTLKTLYLVRPVTFKSIDDLFNGLFFSLLTVAVFGEKFVGVADDLLLDETGSISRAGRGRLCRRTSSALMPTST